MYAALLLRGDLYWYPVWDGTPHATIIDTGLWEETIAVIPLGTVRPIGTYNFYAAIVEHDTVNVLNLDGVTITIY